MSKYVIVGATGDIGKAIHSDLQHEEIISFSSSSVPAHPGRYHHLDLAQNLTERDIEAYFEGDGVIDALIWTPGASLYKMLSDTVLDEADMQYRIGIRSLIAFIKVLLPKLKRARHGRIIVISSVWGRVGASFESVYSAMKGAEDALVKSLSKELSDTSITVNAIAPGAVSGRMTDELGDEDLSHLLAELPQGRLVAPFEVSHAVEYLLDARASSVTGEILNINGGWYT